MKVVRVALYILAGLVAVALAIVAVACVPSVQRWALLRAVRDVPGLRLDVGSVSAGLGGVSVTDLRIERDGIKVVVPSAAVDFSLWRLVSTRALEIHRLEAAKIEIDATRISRKRAREAAAGGPAAAPGVLARLQLPVDLSVDRVALDGRAALAGNAGPGPVTVDFSITGGHVAPDREGEMQLSATVRDPASANRVAALHVQATLRATLTRARGFSKVGLTTVMNAEGPGVAAPPELRIGAELFQATSGENYLVTVDTVQQDAKADLLRLRARLVAGTHRYDGDWELNVRSNQVEPFAIGLVLPEATAAGRGEFSVDGGNGDFSVRGSVQGTASQLERLDPKWKALGTLTTAGDFDVARSGDTLSLNALRTNVSGAAPVLEAHTVVPIRYDLRKHALVGGADADSLLRVNVTGLPLEWLQPFLGTVDIAAQPLTGEFDLGGRGPGSAAVFRGVLRVADAAVANDGRPLLKQAAIELRTEATLAEDRLEASKLAFSLRTPDGDEFLLNGTLATALKPDAPVSLTGTVAAKSARVFARWLPGAPVTATAEVGVTLAGSRVDLQPGKLTLQQAGKVLLNLAVLQPFSFDRESAATRAEDATKPLVRLQLGRLPLAWLPVTDPDAALGGYVQQGELELALEGDRLVTRSVTPLRLAEVSLTQSRRAALGGLAVELQPRFEYASATDYAFQTGDMTVRTGNKTLLTAKADVATRAGQAPMASASFAIELPLLASQPLFADAEAVSAGRATGEVRALIGPQWQLEARVTLNGLISAEGNHVLPVANLGFRGVVQGNGTISLQAPVLLDSGGRRSDLNFALQLSPLGRGYSVDGRLTGQQVELEDLMGLLAVFSASAALSGAERPSSAPASVAPDTTAAWSRFSGQLAVDIKSVTHGTEWSMTGLAGTLAIEPALLSLPQLEAAFSETSRLSAKAELRFTGGPMPYRLGGSYSLNEFDVGRLLKALEPGKAPTIEGLFTVNSQFSGNGETVERAIDRVQGEFQLKSRQGVFRGLQRASSKLSMTSKAVELGASVLGSILGSEKATRTAEKVAGQAYFVDQLAQQLGELKYDLLSVNITRDELLNTNLQDFTLMSEDLRLNGRGSVTYVAGKPWLQQPLAASLELAARGKTEETLGKLRLLSGAKDDLGYAKAKETITVAGTPAKPDPSAFFTRIASAKLSDLLDGN